MNDAQTVPTPNEIQTMLADMNEIDENLFESLTPDNEQQIVEERWIVQGITQQLSRARKDAKTILAALETGDTLGGFIKGAIANVNAAVDAYNDYKASH